MQFAKFIYKTISRLYGASNIVDTFEVQMAPLLYWSHNKSKSVYKFPKTQYKKLYKTLKVVFSLFLISYFILVPADRKYYLSSSNNVTQEEAYTLTPNQLRVAKLLPFNLYSKMCGYTFSFHIPRFARNYLYSSYLTVVGGNVTEVEMPLDHYHNFNSFFTRKIRPNVRQFDYSKGVVNSPVDGRVLYRGLVTNVSGEYQLEQVKGVHFTLEQFLGYVPKTRNPLYYYIIYLSPADYHRVHSPYNWTTTSSKHYPGYLFSVHPMVVSKIKGLFSINERIILEGFYDDEKYFSLSLVGASGVGSMVINGLDQLNTNNGYWFSSDTEYNFKKDYNISDEVGYFQIGSTVVIIFESKNFTFNINPGDKVKLGQNIGIMSD